MTTINDHRAALRSISIRARPNAEIDKLTVDLVAHLIGHDPDLADAIAAMVTGEIAAEYRYGHLAPIAADFLKNRYGTGDVATMLAIVKPVIHYSTSMIMADPAVLDRLLGEVE